ncbi:MAG: response regulator, partial [Bacteroidaceae bacterium]|nr:response regulator [Bacteroidaceae bacterium]
MLLREYLEAKGYSVTLCQDGEEGFETFLQGSFSLCILDVMMPRMDGFTLAGKIRELNYEMPFMFLTAKNLKDDVRAGFELGADDYITKPFSMEEVVFPIEAILRRVRGKTNKDLAVRQIGKFTFATQKQVL